MKYVLLTVAAVILLTACGCHEQAPTVVIDPVDTDAVTTTTVRQEIIDRQLVLTDLLHLNGATMKWSWLESYFHQKTSDTTAEFAVESNNDPSIKATLYVTFDAATNTITQADVTYADVTASMLSDNDGDLYPVMRKMLEAETE